MVWTDLQHNEFLAKRRENVLQYGIGGLLSESDLQLASPKDHWCGNLSVTQLQT
jgi:hypothetical protein